MVEILPKTNKSLHIYQLYMNVRIARSEFSIRSKPTCWNKNPNVAIFLKDPARPFRMFKAPPLEISPESRVQSPEEGQGSAEEEQGSTEEEKEEN